MRDAFPHSLQAIDSRYPYPIHFDRSADMASTMRAMLLERPGLPLRRAELPVPHPATGELLIRIEACGVCRTDLHLVDGELPGPLLPIIPGHEIVGRVAEIGPGVTGLAAGARVGVPWLGWTCGHCSYCRQGQENLCDNARFTGYQLNGGYAEYAVADSRYCFPLDEHADPAHLAPLLCAGLIGYRALTFAGNARRVGIYGFGAAAHIVCQAAKFRDQHVYAFTRPGDLTGQRFALDLGAFWAGASGEAPPEELDAALIFAPVGSLVPEALRRLRKGGTVVCAGIHMSDIPSFPYRILWEERSVKSVANLTRRDGEEFLSLAPRIPVRTQVTLFPLDAANEALEAVRAGRIEGVAVIVP